MMKILTFGELPEDPDNPIIGPYQRLYDLEKKKKFEKEQLKKQHESVDNYLLVDKETPSNIESPSKIEPPLNIATASNIESPSKIEAGDVVGYSKPMTEATKPTISVVKTPSNIESPSNFAPHANIEAGGVKITNNYMRFDMDIFGALRTMSGNEVRIYLEFIVKTYGQIPPKNICSTTNPELAIRTGVSSSSSFAAAIKSLEQRGFIKRIFEAHKKKQKSIYRVFLPCEIQGSRSRTKIESTER